MTDPDLTDPEAHEPTDAAGAAEPPPSRVPREPHDGVPPVIARAADLAAYAALVKAGQGPLAIDAERASGFTYSQRAYLIQVRRAGAGTALIDPIAVPDLGPLQEASAGVEWILHAATQDLPCLAEVGLRPHALFDTELAGRLLGRERVSLAALAESELGEHLEKGHGATDWSKRPLSPAQLRYAALDVELLIDLRNALDEALVESGKRGYAAEEFAALLSFEARPRSPEDWRRTSGVHRIRKPAGLAIVRSLWQARDDIARARDIAPGRLLPDSAIVAVATAPPESEQDLLAVPGFTGRGAGRYRREWWRAITAARALSGDQLPAPHPPASGPPQPRSWADRDPAAFARLEAARAGLAALAEREGMPVENLCSPDTIRRVCWAPPPADQVDEMLADLGARPWQRALVGPILRDALTSVE
jgi:ribonuclease D